MFKVGDLVMITKDCSLQYFAGKTALIIRNVGHDATDHSHGSYYSLQFDDGTEHIFTHREIVLLSRADGIEVQRV